MIHKRYINDFLEEPIELEWWCPETPEEIEKFGGKIWQEETNC